ncbi:hypothetical protein Ddc_10536 [Ditylenchus destructor]|nr:hypothetical protein Ddc_10536 [Ditylenchus destructor]
MVETAFDMIKNDSLANIFCFLYGFSGLWSTSLTLFLPPIHGRGRKLFKLVSKRTANKPLTYWEMFSKAMVEELGESSTDNGASNYQIDPDTMKSWQHFLQVIIDSMMLGYENGRESQINNSFDTQ